MNQRELDQIATLVVAKLHASGASQFAVAPEMTDASPPEPADVSGPQPT